MVKIERILCPTDLSPESDEALRYALALASAYKAKLILFYCRRPGSTPEWVNRWRAEEQFKQSLFTRLDAGELKALDWEGVVANSDQVGFAICKVAAERSVDLIVMRSRRRPRAAALLGSTAETVSGSARCPVLVTHPNEVEWVGISTGEIDLHRVLIAHDFSSDSELALQYGCSLAEEYQAAVHLLHVLDPAVQQDPELAWSASNSDSAEFMATKLQRAIPREALLWCNVVNSVRCGKVHEEVLAYAKEHKIDLICMGASGGDWNLRKVFGSNVDRVLRRAPCPVLVARPTRYAEPFVDNNGETNETTRKDRGGGYDNFTTGSEPRNTNPRPDSLQN